MAAKHITIARESGPKAGFNSYMNGRGRHLHRDEIREAGNAKAQFEAYCSLFGDQFGTVSGNGAARSESQRESVIAKLAAMLTGAPESTDDGVQAFEDDPEENDEVSILVARLAELGVTLPATETPRKAKSKPSPTAPVAKRVSWPMCAVIMRWCNRNGRKFEIVGKTGKGAGASYSVEVDGKALTPKGASDLIASIKA